MITISSKDDIDAIELRLEALEKYLDISASYTATVKGVVATYTSNANGEQTIKKTFGLEPYVSCAGGRNL